MISIKCSISNVWLQARSISFNISNVLKFDGTRRRISMAPVIWESIHGNFLREFLISKGIFIGIYVGIFHFHGNFNGDVVEIFHFYGNFNGDVVIGITGVSWILTSQSKCSGRKLNLPATSHQRLIKSNSNIGEKRAFEFTLEKLNKGTFYITLPWNPGK